MNPDNDFIENVMERISAREVNSPQALIAEFFSIVTELEEPKSSDIRQIIYRTINSYAEVTEILRDEEKDATEFHIGVEANNQGRFDISIPIFEGIFDKLKSFGAEKHENLIVVGIRLASAYNNAESYEKAAALLEDLLSQIDPVKNTLGYAHACNNLGLNYMHLKRFAEAKRYLDIALKIRLKELGSINLDTVATRINLYSIDFEVGNIEFAIKNFHELLDEIETSGQKVSPEYTNILSYISNYYWKKKNLKMCKKYLEKFVFSISEFGGARLRDMGAGEYCIYCLDIILNSVDQDQEDVKSAQKTLDAYFS